MSFREFSMVAAVETPATSATFHGASTTLPWNKQSRPWKPKRNGFQVVLPLIRRVCNNIDSREGWKPERIGETGREQPQAKDNIINFLSLVR